MLACTQFKCTKGIIEPTAAKIELQAGQSGSITAREVIVTENTDDSNRTCTLHLISATVSGAGVWC